jgi:hypothetical protein
VRRDARRIAIGENLLKKKLEALFGISGKRVVDGERLQRAKRDTTVVTTMFRAPFDAFPSSSSGDSPHEN